MCINKNETNIISLQNCNTEIKPKEITKTTLCVIDLYALHHCAVPEIVW